MGKDPKKPRGRMSAYAFFIQMCREEHKKKHPQEQVVFAEFSKKCAEKWKQMTIKEKSRFEEMADRDKERFNREMSTYHPPSAGAGDKKVRRKKDPNAPKRNMSAFFFFCQEVRPLVRSQHPDWSVADIAKEMGKRWEKVTDRTKYEKQAEKDKVRYQKEMVGYKSGSPSKGKASGGKKAVAEEEDDDEDDDDDDDDEDDDE